MREQIVSFETAKLAKEKGFKIVGGTFGFKDKFYEIETQSIKYSGCRERKITKDLIFAPTQTFLQKWLRDRQNIDLSVITEEYRIYACCLDIYTKDGEGEYSDWWTGFKTYEQALEKGLVEALNLIK